MKFGIIGTGMISEFHALAIEAMENGSLHSCYNRSPEKAQAFAAKYGIESHTSLEAFLADPELKIVTIGTPSGAHFDPAMAAIAAGKHVICEKPLEITPERIDQLIGAAEAKQVTLAAILNRRFNAPIQQLKRAVDTGRFGQLSLVEASIKWFRDQAYYDSAAWRGTWALDGGGALMNQSIHIIDQLLYCVGPVKRVSASVACVAHEGIEVEDTAVAILEFENGARGVIQGSTACYSTHGHPAEVNICGSKGSAFLADEAFRVWDFAEAQPIDTTIHAELMEDTESIGIGANDPTKINFTGHQHNFEEVVSSIQQNRRCSVDAHEARKAVELIRAIYDSAIKQGQWIDLSPPTQ
ncbi:Gfo/Idh/MocA family protein [Rubritalea marina]|uniref:Gfo/Idh/MocA family protein n=1 Tax=Rubritalea marina TaxID=361055 RepID=UPI0003685670|nr:Gfo/Idh/MocA family oxidoreductase [Rubritalea marina]